MKPGIYQNIPFDEYRKIPAINKSGLDYVARSPKHFLANLENPREATPALELGSAIHTLVLEPDDFKNRFLIKPENPPRRPSEAQLNAKKPSESTIASIQFWDEFEERAKGRSVISNDDFLVCLAIKNALEKKKSWREFTSDGAPEQTLIWTDPETKLYCKARPDWLSSTACVDLKSARSAEQSDFIREIYDRGYHRQAAWYLDGLAALGRPELLFVFAAVEKEKPFESNVFFMPEEGIEVGRKQNRRALLAYADAVERNDYFGYSDELIEAKCPPWLARREFENAGD